MLEMLTDRRQMGGRRKNGRADARAIDVLLADLFFQAQTQLSMKLSMLINDKMPLIVGILIFISIINTTSKKSLYFSAF